MDAARTSGTSVPRTKGSHAGAALYALAHSAVMLVGVWWLGWSVSFLLVAIWIEMLCQALTLRLLVGRSRHGGAIVDHASAAARSDKPPLTLRRECNQLIIAVLALGVFLALGVVSIAIDPEGVEPMWWWGGGDPWVVVLVGVLGAVLALQPSWRALRAGALKSLHAAYHRQALGVGHALMMLVTLPWLILIGGATLMLAALFAARGASDYWLQRMPR